MYAIIHSLHELLNSNTASVCTNLVCGNLGHLCLTLSPTIYVTLLVTLAVPLSNTDAAFVIPAGATVPEGASIQYTHNVATVAFGMFQNIDRVLRQQLMGVAEGNFDLVLHRPHLSYRGSTTLDMLAHLYTMYVGITNEKWLANYKCCFEL